MTDMVNHPPHYTSHPSGIEAIEMTRWLRGSFSNALKYVLRGWDGLKGDPIEDLEKAIWYLRDALRYGWEHDHITKMSLDTFRIWEKAEPDSYKRSVVFCIIAGNTNPRGFRIEEIISCVRQRISVLRSQRENAITETPFTAQESPDA